MALRTMRAAAEQQKTDKQQNRDKDNDSKYLHPARRAGR
jgi:hypothetical protein